MASPLWRNRSRFCACHEIVTVLGKACYWWPACSSTAFLFLLSWDRVSLCSPCCSGARLVDQAWPRAHPPASLKWALGLKACTTTDQLLHWVSFFLTFLPFLAFFYLFLNFIALILYVCVLSACTSVHHVCLVPRKVRKEWSISWNWSYR